MDTTHIAINTIRRVVQSWIDWNKEQRDKEGLETTPDTHIRTLPVWPSHGQLEEWVRRLNDAETLLIKDVIDKHEKRAVAQST